MISCSVVKKPLSKVENPLESYTLMRKFLVLWKQLEVAKHHWGLHRLGVEDISSPQVYKQFALVSFFNDSCVEWI